MGKRSGWSPLRERNYELQKFADSLHPESETFKEVTPPEKLRMITEHLRQRGPSPIRHPETRQLMWLVWHRECGDWAFAMTRNPRDVTVESKYVLLPHENWQHPQPGSKMICCSCGDYIKKHDLLDAPPPRKKLISIGELH